MNRDTESMRPAPLLALVVPCYNEEEALPSSMDALEAMLESCVMAKLCQPASFICYVDDGSRDNTWQIIAQRHDGDARTRGVKFSANAGHQNAVWAGMEAAREWGADCIISLDADLQDDIGVVPQMLEEYAAGSDIVYGVRNNRSTDTAFKRKTAHFFYDLMGKLHVPMIPDHADYRLVSRQVLNVLPEFGEHGLFLRGLFPTLGFKSSKVYYRRLSRQAGISKYPLRKMLSFAWQGITACSTAPMRIAGLLSSCCMLVALLGCVVALVKYASGDTIPGWTSLMILFLLIGSAQLFCLAIMGEYIAKIFKEVRRRPRYIVEKKL